MTPCYAVDDLANSMCPYSEVSGKGSHSHVFFGVASSDLGNQSICQFRSAATFTEGSSSLSRTVCHVLPLCSHLKMIGSYAGRIIAAMQNNHSARDWTEMQFPRDSVGETGRMLAIGARHHHAAIPGSVRKTVPQPARFGFRDLQPEPVGYRHGWADAIPIAGVRAVADLVVCQENATPLACLTTDNRRSNTASFPVTLAGAVLGTIPLYFRAPRQEFRSALDAGARNAPAALALRGTIHWHCDLSLTRNRGARPGAVRSSDRASSRPNFTTPTRREAD